MNNLGLRIPLLRLGQGENAETGLLSSKAIASIMPTPSKQPFKDTTNHSSEPQLKGLNNELFQSATKQKARERSKTEENNAEFSELGFSFPKTRNCFCCGDDRKSDGELFFESMYAKGPLYELMFVNYRIPEETAYPLDDEDSPQLLPLNDFSAYESDIEPFPAASFWTNNSKLAQDNGANNDDSNDSVLSIPEFNDNSLDLDDTW